MKVLIVFGTRPEAIKLAPLIHELKLYPHRFDVKTCNTGQHKEMLDQVLKFFNIDVDYSLNVMLPNQTLTDLTSRCLSALQHVISKYSPDIVFVQGDTTTALTAALAGFYQKKKIAHLEAGLRSGNLFSPFPEEANRKLISQVGNLHFTPTINAELNLKNEGIKQNVYTVGNSVIDALLMGLKIIDQTDSQKFSKLFNEIDFAKKIILVTAHRRESFGRPLEDICEALIALASNFEDLQVIYPVHLNPNVKDIVYSKLGRIKNVFLFDPFNYEQLIWIMKKSFLILTDSGGIQEEAPSLGKPVLVLREVTERSEGIEAGNSILVGTSKSKIIEQASRLLTDATHYSSISKIQNPYGDGQTCKRIVDILSSIP